MLGCKCTPAELGAALELSLARAAMAGMGTHLCTSSTITNISAAVCAGIREQVLKWTAPERGVYLTYTSHKGPAIHVPEDGNAGMHAPSQTLEKLQGLLYEARQILKPCCLRKASA